MAFASPLSTEPNIRPISDLRTHLADIETEAKEGPVILNRNGKPALMVVDYEAEMAQREAARDARLLHEAEMWDRACGGKTYSIAESRASFENFAEELEEFLAAADFNG